MVRLAFLLGSTNHTCDSRKLVHIYIFLFIFIVVSTSTLARTGTDTSKTVTIANLAGTLLIDDIAIEIPFRFKQPIINEIECRHHIGFFGRIHVLWNIKRKVVSVRAQFLGDCQS